MKFIRLKLKNFRQYLGEHIIDFSGINETEKVTLIYGANGYGKTGIFRAIMFCLYGDLYLEQDFLNKTQAKKGLILVNEKLLEDNPEMRISSLVELTIEHQKNSYLIKREIHALLKNNEITQELGDIYFQESDCTGNTKPPIHDYEEIEHKISLFLHKNVKNYFLFDGERMERLTKGGDEQKKEVQHGIKSLLQLDTLDEAINGLRKQEKNLTKKIRDNSSGELEQISEILEKVNKCILKYEDDIKNLENEVQALEHSENETEEELNKFKEIVDKQERKKNIKKRLSELSSEKENNKRKIREILTTSGAYISSHVTAELLANLETKIDKGELPSGIKENFINHLLEISMCICGEHLRNDSEEGKERRERILFYKKQNIQEGMDVAFKLSLKLKGLDSTVLEYKRKYEDIISSEQKIYEEMKSINRELDMLNEELQGIPETQNLAFALQKIKEERKQLESKKPNLNFNLEQKIKEEKNLQEKQRQLSQKNEIAKKFSDQRDYIKKALDTLIAIQNKYAELVRIKLSESATHFFKELADEETLLSLDKIEINNDFELDVLNKSGRGMLFQISSGQRQIVSLSYICAILHVGNNIEVPLLMDTPLGRLSGEHRERCLEKLPKLTTQLIMLATDTEFQENEARALRASGFWGKAYKIKPESDRESKLINLDVNNWIPTRKTLERIIN